MLKSTLALVALAASLFAASAHAETYTETLAGKNITLISTPGEGSAYTVSLTSNGVPVPMLGGGCFHSTRPGTRYLLCSFNLGDGVRLEFYPFTQTVSGCVKIAQYVLWQGNNAQAGSLGPNVCAPQP